MKRINEEDENGGGEISSLWNSKRDMESVFSALC